MDTSSNFLVLSAKLESDLSSKISETIHSGLVISFSYQVELMKKRSLWFDEEISANNIIHTVKYDTLSKQYTVNLNNNSDNPKDKQVLITDSFEQMKNWVAILDKVKITPTFKIKTDSDYYIQLKAQVEALDVPFPWGYVPFIDLFENIETPWAVYPLNQNLQKQ